MPSITGHDYDCPTRTLTVTINGNGSMTPYRVYGVVVPEASSLPGGDFPPEDAPSVGGAGDATLPLSSPIWPSTGTIKYRVWLLVSGGQVDGGKSCSSSSSSSSLSSSSSGSLASSSSSSSSSSSPSSGSVSSSSSSSSSSSLPSSSSMI